MRCHKRHSVCLPQRSTAFPHHEYDQRISLALVIRAPPDARLSVVVMGRLSRSPKRGPSPPRAGCRGCILALRCARRPPPPRLSLVPLPPRLLTPLGLINNVLYVMILSAAQDLVGSSVPKGVVLLADVLPSFFTKLIAPYFIHRVSYSLRVLVFITLSAGGMLLVALTPA